MSAHNTLWSGRYEQQAAASLRRLNDSYPFDKRLYADDIVCSIAYAQALGRAAVLSEDEVKKITEGLELVWREFDAGLFLLKPGDEDVHTAVERRLTELIGAPAGKLHTGRSRNDQIATDVRHWLLATVRRVQVRITELQRALLAQAKHYVDTVMPGYTHLRAAQPITAAHWLMSYFWMLTRDHERLNGVYRQCAISPLGSGALAGTPYSVDRQTLAEAMGFESITANSLDAVSDRDFIVDFIHAAALHMVHLSRFAEDVIIYSSPQFGYIQLDERYTTGSSIMPQKQNPDVLELARGKAGRIAGHLSGVLNTLKGLPSTYNKDLQEDKEPLFDTADTLETLLPALTGLVSTMTLIPAKLEAGLDEGMLATDVADYLVARGVPFREAHGIVGRLVRRSIDTNTPLSQLPLEDYTTISPLFSQDVFALYDYAASAAKRSAPGGTAPSAVRAQIELAETILSSSSSD
ncbi:MAG: argininosuccinate lyase [Anaerolineae bacterium]|nr:argininosuccinate lyase [Anaerolineae bacterium]